MRGRILVADDEPLIRRVLADALAAEGHEVETAESGGTALARLREADFDVAFADIRMPELSGLDLLARVREAGLDTQIILMTGHTTLANAIEAMKRGAYDYLTKPFDLVEVRALAQRALEVRRLTHDLARLKREIGERDELIVGQGPAMQEIYKVIGRVAETDATVLIQGESGTGKELIAKVIHHHSPGWRGPFVAVNCSAIPRELLESELFGHERGAFTGAVERRCGKFEQAEGGTLFLDEVGDISPLVQPKLLRFLETGEFRRVGGTNSRTVDVRVISATNKNLQEEVRAGRFRDDLLYRLNVVSLRLPPLRERKEDIPLLVEHFLQRKTRTKRIGPGTTEVLTNYDWPGNVRELEHVIEGAIALAHSDVIEPKDLWMNVSLHRQSVEEKPENAPGSIEPESLEEVERRHIEKILRANNWNRAKSAQILGITAKTLYLKIKRYKLIEPSNGQ